MRNLKLVLVLLMGSTALYPQNTAQSIQLSDMDKTADPCTDFYQYANGAWRAQNPIPASMQRWSRRWQAGENSKENLKTILDVVSQKTNWPQGSTEQLIGDYYGSCMDETKIDKLGVAPAKPLLAEIDSLKKPADIPVIVRKLQHMGLAVPFSFGSSPDNHNPSETIAFIGAGGLGLPDRDYYFKTEQRFADARAKYLVHVANIFKLAGYNDAAAKAAAATVFDFEEKLAGASLDNVALRDPSATDHKMTFAQLDKLSPILDWPTFFSDAHISRADLNVAEPKFLEQVEKQLHESSLAVGRPTLNGSSCIRRQLRSQCPSSTRTLRFTVSILAEPKNSSPAGNAAPNPLTNCWAKLWARNT